MTKIKHGFLTLIEIIAGIFIAVGMSIISLAMAIMAGGEMLVGNTDDAHYDISRMTQMWKDIADNTNS